MGSDRTNLSGAGNSETGCKYYQTRYIMESKKIKNKTETQKNKNWLYKEIEKDMDILGKSWR